MPYSINDYIKRFTGGSDIASGLSSWFSRTHAESIQDAEKRYLLAQGGTSDGTIQDLWKEILTKSGYTGGVGDQLYSYWKAPVVFKLGTSTSPIFGSTGTFVRATTKTYTDSDGDLQSAAISELVHTNIGFILEPQRTNKCTNYNANPDVGLTGLTLNDLGSGATLTRVDKSAELAAAGLSNICTDGNVFKLVSGTAGAQVLFGGTTGNTNKHSLFAYVMVESGSTIQINMSGGGGAVTSTSTSLVKLESPNLTPPLTTSFMVVQAAGAGQTVYFILDQMEEGANVTSSIITEGSATTRNADQLSYPTTNIPTNDCVLSFDWTPTAAAQGTVVLWGSGSSSANFFTIFHDGANIIIRRRLSSLNNDSTKALAYTADTTYKIKARQDSILGLDVWIEDVKGSNNANTTDSIYGVAQYVGSHYDGSLPQTGGINNFTVYSGSFTDEEVVNL